MKFKKDYKFSPNKNFSNSVGNLKGIVAGDYYIGEVKIIGKSQPGPVIFVVTDGQGSVDAVIKDSQYNAGEVVHLEGQVNERAGRLQLEIDVIKPSKIDFNAVIEKSSEPIRKEFSIKSDRLEKLKPYFVKIAKRMRKAVFDNQPILIRHHADADGIISGLAIEHSCKALMESIGLNPDYNLYRSPSRAPFYEIADVFRDAVLTKRIIESHGQKKPLVIVLDNGSTPEDILGIRTIKSLGFEVVVVDHHNPVIIENKKTAVCPYVPLHLNPYIEGLDSKTCAGMLAYELARMIYEKYDSPMLPAIAGISDHCEIQETEDYIKKSGKSRKFLESIGVAIDFISYNLKFDGGRGLFEQVLVNEEFVTIINEEVKKGVETQLQSTLPYLRTQDIDGIVFSTIDLEKYTVRFKYPAP